MNDNAALWSITTRLREGGARGQGWLLLTINPTMHYAYMYILLLLVNLQGNLHCKPRLLAYRIKIDR